METKTVAITMGDPAGIGPEIIVKALPKTVSTARRWWLLDASQR